MNCYHAITFPFENLQVSKVPLLAGDNRPYLTMNRLSEGRFLRYREQ